MPHPELLEAIDRIEARRDLVTFMPEEWNSHELAISHSA